MPNRLAGETSPYLLQHKDNPVAWQPWDERSLAQAREQDKPLLISIGYSACHWCHVMERESFEDPEVAALMNEHFVPIKVDREERPDVDAIYMDAVQAMTGHGGWPLNAFATPEQVPFYAGTYFPPEPRHGLPSWRQVLEAVAEAWAARRDEIRSDAAGILPRLQGAAALRPTDDPISTDGLPGTTAALARDYDRTWGGWGAPHKFPPHATLAHLLARAAVRGDAEAGEMALHTLRQMAAGGICDQVGGGFSRYAVDRFWRVPHFEKMLYDNAQLARAYLHGHLLSGDALLRRTCEETLEFVMRELRAPDGGLYAALDADSEGVEGKFYVWTVDELRSVLGADADAAIGYFGATPEGNFEGACVLEAHGPEPAARREIRTRLLEARSHRVRPGLDDKRIAAWNALAIQAFAEAGAALGREEFLGAARQAADFVLTAMRGADGRLLRTFNHGQARLNAYLEDHALLVEALLALYEATFEPRWFHEARATADAMIARFADDENGGFFATAADHEQLAARRKDLEDMPVPAGQSSAALGLLRLAMLTGEESYERHATGVLRLLHGIAPQHPQAFGHALQALELYAGPRRELALVGEDTAALEAVVRARPRPLLVTAGRTDDGSVPLLAGRDAQDGRASAYLCERFACRRPVSEPGELAALLGDA